LKLLPGIIALTLFMSSIPVSMAQQRYSAARLEGKWLKPISVVPPSGKAIKEGMILKPGGALDFVNINSMKGDKWELKNDTLIIWSHSEHASEPLPNKFVITKLTGSSLVLRPGNGTQKRNIIYKRYK
jgi:hypothetical protein